MWLSISTQVSSPGHCIEWFDVQEGYSRSTTWPNRTLRDVYYGDEVGCTACSLRNASRLLYELTRLYFIYSGYFVVPKESLNLYLLKIILVRHMQGEHPFEPLFPSLNNTSTWCIFWDQSTQNSLEHHVDAARRPVGPPSISLYGATHSHDASVWAWWSGFPSVQVLQPERSMESEWERFHGHVNPELSAPSGVNLELMEYLGAAWCYIRDLLHFCINGAYGHALISSGSEVVTYPKLEGQVTPRTY